MKSHILENMYLELQCNSKWWR